MAAGACVSTAATGSSRPSNECSRKDLGGRRESTRWSAGEGAAHASFDPSARSVWVLDGLLYYLSREENDELLRNIQRLAPAGSLVLGDLSNWHSMRRTSELPVWRQYGEPMKFGVDMARG